MVPSVPDAVKDKMMKLAFSSSRMGAQFSPTRHVMTSRDGGSHSVITPWTASSPASLRSKKRPPTPGSIAM